MDWARPAFLEVEVEGGIPVPLAADGALKFNTGGRSIDLSFNTCEVAKKFRNVVPFVEGADADEVDVDNVGFSKRKGSKGVAIVLDSSQRSKLSVRIDSPSEPNPF
jgi:hypothetical protein